MAKRYVRNLLLGTSMVFLLAGGAAFAQDLYVSVDKECVECFPLERGDVNTLPLPIPEEYQVSITYGGWVQDPDYWLCSRTLPPHLDEDPLFMCFPPPAQDPQTRLWFVPCDLAVPSESPLMPEGIAGVPVIEDLYGEWTFQVKLLDEGNNLVDSAEASWLLAEDCVAAMFVPEPGSLLLLGSGVAGLAGYASLRRRSARHCDRRLEG